MVHTVVFWSVGLLLALWVLVGLVELGDALFTECARGASEISDPCARGKGTYLAYGLLVWLVGALPLVAILVFVARKRP